MAVGTLIARGAQLPDGSALAWSTKVRQVIPEWGLGRQPGHARGVDGVDERDSAECTLDDLAGMRTGLPVHLFSRG